MKKFGVIALLLATIFVVIGYLLPKQVHVERSVTIERPRAMLFAILNGYQHFNDWSPWVKRDPNATYAVSGPPAGIGAHLSWSGDPRLVGSGWQEIIASKPDDQIDIRLDFDTQGLATTHFYLQTTGTGSRVTWAFDSDVTEDLGFIQGFLARYFGLFFDRWIGGDYEQGLLNLKKFAESLPVSDFVPADISQVTLAAQNILYVTTSSSQESVDIANAMAAAFAEIVAFINTSGNQIASPPMAITRTWEEGGYVFDAAIPVKNLSEQLRGNIKAGKSPAGAAIKAIHKGGYGHMLVTYEKLASYMKAHGLGRGGVSWEQYISDPKKTAEQDRLTYVYIMLDQTRSGGPDIYQRDTH